MVALGLATVLPSLYFVAVGFSEDETATGSAGGAVLFLVGVVAVVGAVLAILGVVAARSQDPGTRRALNTFVLLVAVAAGLVTGFLGGVIVTMERHPTWDDA